MTAIVLNSIQTSFLNERILDLIEAPAQPGRAFNSAILTGPNRESVALAPKKVGCAFPRWRVSDFVPECVTRFALWSFAEAHLLRAARQARESVPMVRMPDAGGA